MMMKLAALILGMGMIAPALAQDGGFAVAANGAVVHVSGFVCPAKIGAFERDAVGLRDPQTSAYYCTYSALSGIYGTVVILPLPSPFDPKAVLASAFRVQDGSGSAIVGEKIQTIGPPGAALPVYLRLYRTARLERREYRTLYASGVAGAWVVEVIVEYSEPQDKDLKSVFVNAVYGQAVKEFGGPAGP